MVKIQFLHWSLNKEAFEKILHLKKFERNLLCLQNEEN